MLTSLTIKNYALIEHLHVNFNGGLTIITGETGAGKSILLGGLSLILGKRADLTSVKDQEQKCIVEAIFNIEDYKLEALFKSEDLDYEPQTIIRREILPSGKSRAFVNDSPVNLSSLQVLSSRLIDIHSQHETLQLINEDFQFQVIDSIAENKELLKVYQIELKGFKEIQKNHKSLLVQKSDSIKEYDYNSFLLNELVESHLKEGELEELEAEYELLNNVEDIQDKLTHSIEILTAEQIGLLSELNQLKLNFQNLSTYSIKYKETFERIQSVLIELDDIYEEVENFQSSIETDPNRLEFVDARLQTINNLFKKHLVDSVSDLIKIKNQLSDKVSKTENLDSEIHDLERLLEQKKTYLNELASQIHEKREVAIPQLIIQLKDILNNLGMANAQFKIELSQENEFLYNGMETIQFLFTANKGGHFSELKKAVSGGELSRIMLAVKCILSNYIKLPSIMFDEIDTGVSGEVSHKMGDIMLQMSNNMQVFSITHLPQIAAKGHSHFKVFKEDHDDQTITKLVRLNQDERILEIAQMLGGSKISNSAMAHAKQLLN